MRLQRLMCRKNPKHVPLLIIAKTKINPHQSKRYQPAAGENTRSPTAVLTYASKTASHIHQPCKPNPASLCQDVLALAEPPEHGWLVKSRREPVVTERKLIFESNVNAS